MRKETLGMSKKLFFFFFLLQSSYSELLLITTHCSSMLNFLVFSIFDIGVSLSFEVIKMLKNSI